MTIKFYGHVEKIACGRRNKVLLTLYASTEVCTSNPILIEVTKGEAELYRPGVKVEFTIDRMIEGIKDGMERALEILIKAWPRAHNYASDNAYIYHAQDAVREKIIQAIRAEAEKIN